MKKLLLGLIFLFSASVCYGATLISPEAFLTPNDVTIAHLEDFRTKVVNAINSADGGNIQDGTISADKLDADATPHNRWNEAFNDFVYTGLIPPTSVSLATTTTAGTAYIEGIRVVKDATAHTYSAGVNGDGTTGKWTFVDLSSSGTYTYSEIAINGSTPAVTTNSIRLCRVSSDATTIAAVRDDRVTGVSLAIEDYYRKGLSLSVTSPDAISIAPGIAYVGSTRIIKTAASTLSTGTAADWAGGVSLRALSTKGYVVVNASGDIKLTTIAPTKSDTSGNTVGDLRYSVIVGVYYRCLSWFYMDDIGTGNIKQYSYWGDWKDGGLKDDLVQIVTSVSRDSQVLVGNTVRGSTAIPYDDSKPAYNEGELDMTLVIIPTSTTSKIEVEAQGSYGNDGGGYTVMGLFQDGTGSDLAKASAFTYLGSAGAADTLSLNYSFISGTISPITLEIRGGANANSTTFNGVDTRKYGGSLMGRITAREYKQ